MSPEPLLIALTFDAEADAFDPSIAPTDPQSWRGIEEGIPVVDSLLHDRKDSFGEGPRSTWFVRCDDQVADLTGSHAYLLDHYRPCWATHQANGDEIGFHPHLYQPIKGKWVQETDADAIVAQIDRSYAAMRAAGFDGKVSRMGEAFGSNAVMQALDQLGMRSDSSAMPGRVRMDGARSLDWSMTPSSPYYPSCADYRITGEPARKVLQIPMSMAWTRATYDKEPFRRYVDLSFHHEALRKGIPALVAEARIIVTITHPSTVLPPLKGDPHGLLSFRPEDFALNLDCIEDHIKRLGRPFRFVTLSEAVDILNA